jgi:hypothetical protein
LSWLGTTYHCGVGGALSHSNGREGSDSEDGMHCGSGVVDTKKLGERVNLLKLEVVEERSEKEVKSRTGRQAFI